jgi:predicted TIM-barrel fold metal-dependent hydrolase
VVIDWHVHAGEAEFFERYPHYADSFRKFWEPFVRLYNVDIFKTMNQPLESKLRMLQDAGVDRAVFIGLDLAPDFDFRIPIEYLAELERRHPERIIGFPALNPKKGIPAALEDIEEMAARGIRGFKAFPCFWGDPSDRRYYPLWERAADRGLIAMFHMGSQIAPGARLKWCLPHLLDDVAMDFPALTIVIAHMGWPWIAETVMGLGRKNPNVYFDTGALRPSLHFGDVDFTAKEGIYRYIERQIPGKILYGSDYPNGDPREMVPAFKELPLDPGFLARFLGENARRVLKLPGADPP